MDLLHMPRLAQVGIYVKDMDKSIERFENVFGIGPWLVLEGDTDYCLDRGCEAVVKGRIAMGYTGRVQLSSSISWKEATSTSIPLGAWKRGCTTSGSPFTTWRKGCSRAARRASKYFNGGPSSNWE